MKNSYDIVFALAVFEHFSQNDLKQSASVISKMLTKNGRLIITVPESKVDDILFFLKSIKLIDGETLEEHHHFNSNNIFKYFSKKLNLIKHKKFQLGLNNNFNYDLNLIISTMLLLSLRLILLLMVCQKLNCYLCNPYHKNIHSTFR